jgi:type IV pilus assembly protein PilM
MSFKRFFKKREPLLAIDIGSTAVRLLELDTSSSQPKVLNVAAASLSGKVFSNYSVSNGQEVAERIGDLLKVHGFTTTKRVALAVPGPSVFTKRIKVPRLRPEELAATIRFEAVNFIPHNIEAVKLDSHVLGVSGKKQLDVLVAAVKNEIIDSFVHCISLANLEVAVVDVDFFAMQNAFEMAYPELLDKNIALLDIGGRYSGINICKQGKSLLTGDVSVGGKFVTEAIMDEFGLSISDAEEKKLEGDAANKELSEVISNNIGQMTSEINRQLTLLWNSAGLEESIDKIFVTGGGSELPGLIDALAKKTDVECERMDCFRHMSIEDSLKERISKFSSSMSIAAGLALREPEDKIALS